MPTGRVWHLEGADRQAMIQFAQRWLGAAVDWRLLVSLRYLPRFVADWLAFRRQRGSWQVNVADSYPCLADRLPTTPFDPHYFYQGNWLARRLADARPVRHVDVGSSVLMVGVLSAHVPTVFVDYRPLVVRQSGLLCLAADINRLPFVDRSVQSLSSLHVIEHVGLGRYGDPVNVDGARQAACELQRVVGQGGKLYLSTPIGRERVCFNAHRVFAPTTILSWFSALDLVSFSYVSDEGVLCENASATSVANLDYGCGFFEFRRADGIS
jgi:Caenorhabditis protein of unknown function, DUF268